MGIVKLEERAAEGIRKSCSRKFTCLDVALVILVFSISFSAVVLVVLSRQRAFSDPQSSNDEETRAAWTGPDKEDRAGGRKCGCNYILNSGSEGHWVKDSSHHMPHSFLNDAELRRRLKLPGNLYREDLRCGINFPIANSTLPSACNGMGEHYCCTELTGWCGNSVHHCSHSKSTNYREFIPSQNSVWVTAENGCNVDSFTKQAACELLSDRGYKLIFIGDSQARRLFSTFLLFLSGDFSQGLLDPSVHSTSKKHCLGEMQLLDPECRHFVYDSSLLVQDRTECGFASDFLLEYFADFQTFLTSRTSKRMNSLLGLENTIVILGAGLHFDSNEQSFIDFYLSRLSDITKNSTWPKLIIETLPKVPSVTISDRRRTFRDAVTKFCKKRSLFVLDNFDLTTNLQPYDGKHFGLTFQMLKVNILLGFLNQDWTVCKY